MALYTSNNITALRANTALQSIYNNLATSVERLSSGLRVNSSSDDPAGMAVSESMKARIAAYTQGKRNLDDAISMVQTAEGNLSIIDEDLTRMKELAEQAATGTYTDDQRLIMHSEFTLMGAEIDRLATDTSYNGIKLLDGSLSSNSWRTTPGGWKEPDTGARIHFGPNNNRAEDYYYVSMPSVSSSTLFSNQTLAISTQASAQTALPFINTAMIRKENAVGWLGALENRLESTLNAMDMETDTLTQAENNITSVDYATEIAEFIRNQVMSEAGVAMLAQANVLPQMALSLLQQSV